MGEVVRIADLAERFAQIEQTSGRLESTRLLAELFRQGPEDVGILPYLLAGRLGPPYAAPDIGIDERRIAQALAAATGSTFDAIWQAYRERGDLGLVAEAQLSGRRGGALSVQEVYRQLRAIAETTGHGATERKVGLLDDLLRRLGPREARYVVRIVQGRLRLGVADAAVLDALSLARAGDLSLRPRLERAYSYCSDLGLVAQTLFARGPEALETIRPTPGRPVLPALAERLPSPEAVVEKLGRVLAEPKYDGLRLQAHKDGEQVWLFTRRLEDVTHAFPDIARGVRSQVRAVQAILDGEAVGYDPRTERFLPFQETARRRRKHAVAEMEARYPLRYYVFDLLYYDGEDFTPQPQHRRSHQLRQIITDETSGPVLLTPQIETADPRELARFLNEMVGRGLEGVMVKRPDAAYQAGARGFAWVKLKPAYQEALADTFDVVVVGYYRGRGKRAALGIGSLLCAVYDPPTDRFRTVTRVGSGLSEEEWVTLREMLDAIRVPARPRRVDSLLVPDIWVEPQYVVEVIAGDITRSPQHTCGQEAGQPGYALRFPRIARLRLDRRPEDATTQAEVRRLYALRTGADQAIPERPLGRRRA